jgi:hypothetical protein
MKFGLITPVFDGCLESLQLVYQDLKLQTHADWVWMLCSNGYSRKLADFARDVNSSSRTQAIYVSAKREEEKNAHDILANVCKRRNLCIRLVECDYIFLIDADAKILDPNMFEIINVEVQTANKKLCVYDIIHEVGRLPIFPIGYGRIDTLNYCVEAGLAKRIGYPTVIRPRMLGNDFRFFDRLRLATGHDYLYLNRIFCQHNGNNRYEHLMDLLATEIRAEAQ